MAKYSALRPTPRAAKLAARNPRRTGRTAWGGAKRAARHPRTIQRGAGLLGRSARAGTALWAKGKATKAGGRAGAKTGAKVLRVAGPGRQGRTRLVATGAVAVVGTYLLDPKNGKRRRRVVIDKAGKVLRRTEREAERKGRYAEGVAQGVAHKAGAGEDRTPAEARLNDPALARKVESEIFRDRHALKGAVNVMAENGVVSLRGQVEGEREIGELVAAAQKVDGVRQVENLMHTPGTPAPHKPDGGPGSGAA